MAFFSSCGEKKAKDGRTDTPTSGTIEFVADESLSPIIDEERSQFEFEYPKAKLKPKYTDEVTGLQMIKDFKTALLFTTRNLKDSEIAYLKSKSNVIPSVFPIGYDGLAFIVNKNNSDTCITVNDIKRVLTGKATKWSDIVPGSKRGDIEVIFDNTRSATTNFVVDSVHFQQTAIPYKIGFPIDHTLYALSRQTIEFSLQIRLYPFFRQMEYHSIGQRMFGTAFHKQ